MKNLTVTKDNVKINAEVIGGPDASSYHKNLGKGIIYEIAEEYDGLAVKVKYQTGNYLRRIGFLDVYELSYVSEDCLIDELNKIFQ